MRYLLPAFALILAVVWLGLVNLWLLLVPLALALLALIGPRWVARRRLASIMAKGDVRALLRAWRGSVTGLSYPEAAIPLMIATAYASFGWVDEARRARAHVVAGPALEASREQLEFVDVLLEIYEGDRDEALRRAELLVDRPAAVSQKRVPRRIREVRRGLLAIARAFAHRATDDDRKTLIEVRKPVPILAWPIRYAEAIVAIDSGDWARASAMLSDAPAWPENSVFCTFQRELQALVAARVA